MCLTTRFRRGASLVDLAARILRFFAMFDQKLTIFVIFGQNLAKNHSKSSESPPSPPPITQGRGFLTAFISEYSSNYFPFRAFFERLAHQSSQETVRPEAVFCVFSTLAECSRSRAPGNSCENRSVFVILSCFFVFFVRGGR